MSPAEIKVFIHNAQNVLANEVRDERIPALHMIKEHLVKSIPEDTKISPVEWSCIFVSAAWDIFNQGTK